MFAFALAVQNLLWGLGQPFAGTIADRFGAVRVMCVGALMYAVGLLLMRYATAPPSLDLAAGVLIGFGLVRLLVQSACCRRSASCCRRNGAAIALGAGTAAGSFGQFLFSPFGVVMIDNFGWQRRS